MSQNWMSLKMVWCSNEMSLKMECQFKCNVTKNKMPLKICHSNWIPQNGMSTKM